MFREDKGKVFAYLQLRFIDFQISEIQSFASYKLENLIADCGALLGLFMGISFISILNTFLKFLVYIFTKIKELKKEWDETDDFAIEDHIINHTE